MAACRRAARFGGRGGLEAWGDGGGASAPGEDRLAACAVRLAQGASAPVEKQGSCSYSCSYSVIANRRAADFNRRRNSEPGAFAPGGRHGRRQLGASAPKQEQAPILATGEPGASAPGGKITEKRFLCLPEAKSGARQRHDATPPAILPRRVVANRRGFLPAQDPRRKTQDLFVRGSPKR